VEGSHSSQMMLSASVNGRLSERTRMEAKKILLVEDNANDIELTLAALEEHHLDNEVVVARDGAEALEYLYQTGAFQGRPPQNPVLILLDLKMPKIDGLEVLRRVKGDPQLAAIPVVVLTASREESDIVQAYQFGVNAYVVKPVAFDNFVEVVKQLSVFWLLINETPPPYGGRP
jgi:CheY-like chemotaxis protein